MQKKNSLELGTTDFSAAFFGLPNRPTHKNSALGSFKQISSSNPSSVGSMNKKDMD